MLRALITCAALMLPAFTAPGVAQTTPDAPLQAQVVPNSALARENPDLHALFQAMGLYDVLEIMSIEGIEYGQDLEAEMFPGQGGAAWRAIVSRIYNLDRLTSAFETALPADAFSEEEFADLAAFFASDIGQRIVEGEVVARREIMDPVVEEAANIIYREELAAMSPRLELLETFNDANSLVDLNVAGALNSNFAFYRGLADGDAFEIDLPEDIMLAEIWGQEPEIREETVLWLYSYQLMAYDELSDADLQAYIDLSNSSAGQALNRALFAAFDAMFEAVSYDLGAAAALFVAGEET
ncbi:DUF2059 domain-containing protein [Rhodophyticola porphyridii]|uniref:DUF2059 domain-containing protein n=1 Tax=Rhodophyticola porphyridii TaxID=1852017 RepID=A0A3L9XY44_9RHOB|nr:DUF2059 domain-containing protein [Rhodophyticola porphyridii]RMA41434.1 DUF2059 domain-containing protein [Rhodophyticola porphyridii]